MHTDLSQRYVSTQITLLICTSPRKTHTHTQTPFLGLTGLAPVSTEVLDKLGQAVDRIQPSAGWQLHHLQLAV